VEVKIMKNKIIGIFVSIMLLMTAIIVIVPDDLNVEATPGGGGGDKGGVGLNQSYIHMVTENLSNIVKTYPKGRTFGTDGEHYARDRIEFWMNDIGLYNVTIEQMKNITSGFDKHAPSIELTEKLEILSLGITINEVNETSTKVIDCYIQPKWNWRFLAGAIEYFFPNVDEGLEWLLDVLGIDTNKDG
jgi:hypothetical protein